MLRLRSSILARLLSSPPTIPGSSVHRLLSAAAPAVSPIPSFAVEDYLVDTCGLTRAQALKSSTKLSHLKSPTNSDVVLAFLADLGLSSADVAAVVAKDPQFLCAKVEKTLASNVAGLTGLGLSSSEVARLVSLVPRQFRISSIVSQMYYYLPILGSCENVLLALKFNAGLLTNSLERIVKPNVAVLREWGLGDCDIAKLGIAIPMILTTNSEHLRMMVACAEGIGVPRGSPMFRHALQAVAFLNEGKITAKLDCLKNMFRWSDAEVSIAVSKFPMMLTMSMDMLRSNSEFLISEVGLEPAYIAHRPAMLSYSLEGWLRPRYYVVQFLKENGLLDHDRSYYSAVMVTEKAFMEKYISPHDEAAPHLAEDYATACAGEVLTSFRFALTKDML